MTTIELKTELRTLSCKLTPEEKLMRAEEAGAQCTKAAKLRAEEESLKEQIKAVKSAAEAFEKSAGALMHSYDRGYEDRAVEVRVEYDETTKQVYTVRLDTGEHVGAPRPLTSDEHVQIAQVTTEQVAARGGSPKARRGAGN